jgi:hypothetical protein
LKTANKKITASLFTLLLAAPLLFILFCHFRQQEIRHSMKRQLEDKMLHTITLDKTEVYWMKDGKEILINGRMFDVKSFRQSGSGKIIFTGLYDDDETALVNKIRETQETDCKADGKLLVQLFQLLQSSFNNAQTEIFIPTHHNNFFREIKQNLASQYFTILSPPPQV